MEPGTSNQTITKQQEQHANVCDSCRRSSIVGAADAWNHSTVISSQTKCTTQMGSYTIFFEIPIWYFDHEDLVLKVCPVSYSGLGHRAECLHGYSKE